MAGAYYNEIDHFAAEWLRNLIAAGEIPAGEVDERDIRDVDSRDLEAFDQCHFFAGVGGWPYALRLVGWPDDRPVWTGSCPCQPFSAAGRGEGYSDARHLAPVWLDLIAECRPASLFGEQVASAAGRAWLAALRAEMEDLGYALGAADMCAAGIGAPHIRQRLWFGAQRMGDADGAGPKGRRERGNGAGECATGAAGVACGLADADGRHPGSERLQRGGEHRPQPEDGGNGDGLIRPRPVNSPWQDADWLFCRDGRWRPVEPGSQPLAHGLPRGMGTLGPRLARLARMAGLDGAGLERAKSHRIGSIRGYGNAVNVALTVEFIRAYLETKGGAA